MKLAYEITLPTDGGNPNLAPIILLHGRMDSKKTWKRIAPEIAQKTGREVYAVDARNHGDSPWSDEMNFDVLTEDLDELMEDLSIPKAILLGHSLGGRTALTYALKKPHKVEMLIVEDMFTQKYSTLARVTVQQLLHLCKASLAAIPEGATEMTAKKSIIDFIKSSLSSFTKESNIFEVDTLPVKKKGNSYVWQANLDVLEDMLMSDKMNQELSGVFTADTLFLYGTESFFNVPSDKDIPLYFPRASLVGIDGAGHLIHQDFPKEFLNHILNFILKSQAGHK